MGQTTKQKGDLLEDVVQQICSRIACAVVGRNAKVHGKKTNTERDIDILIEGKFGAFEVKIAVEKCQNHAEPVGVEKVEAFKAKLEDIGGDLGVMVCPRGFTEGARNRAKFDGIQLFEIYDAALEKLEPVQFRYGMWKRNLRDISFSSDIARPALSPFRPIWRFVGFTWGPTS